MSEAAQSKSVPGAEPGPPEESIAEAQEDLVDSFALLDDWMDKYQYIIDLGRQLPDFPEDWKTEANMVRGCQSQVWLVESRAGDRLVFHAISDAAIVSGLIAILLRIYSNRTPAEILATPPDFVGEIGLDQHLSTTRGNGLKAMLKTIFARAEAAQAG